jgi:subtilase family serine protease
MGRLLRVGAILSACALGATLSIAPTAAAAGPVRLGSAPAVPKDAHIAGALATSVPLHITVTLKPRNPARLAAFAEDVSTPGSPLYRDYITPAQFAQRFGATPDAVQAVESSLKAHGLVPGPVSANSLSIRVTATASQLSRAFSTSFARVALASGKTAIVNQQAPLVDPGVAGDVQAVIGLNTLSTAKPLLVRSHRAATATTPHVVPATGGPEPCAAASSVGASMGGFTSDQIAAAYGLSGLYQSGDEGAGQTVAVLELESYDPGDIAAFDQCYGASTLPTNVSIDGGAGSGAGAGEAALDIENVIGLAPKAKIDVYEGPNSGNGPYDVMNAIISQRAAQVVTTSWGQCEELEGFSQATSENALFEEAAAQGMTIVSASGDDGSEDCFPTPQTLQVDDPASQPFVTGVGGTTLSANPTTGARLGETVWNDGPSIGASGGGISSFWTMPSYQKDAPGSLHVVNGNSSGEPCRALSGDCREVPDVSADGDPNTGYVIYWNGSNSAVPPATVGWQVVGGTSAAAPAWAALIALTNASTGCAGAPIGFANPALYHAGGVAYSSDFNDVTSGDNDMTGTFGLFPAGSGYDMATGLGSPNGTALAQALCTDAITLANPGSQRSTVKTSVSLQIRAADTRGAAVTYKATGLPSGLAINGSTGKITGRPNRLGTSTVTTTVANAEGTGAETTFAWTIQGAPTLSHLSLSSVGVARPRLSFTVTAGRGAPSVKSINVTLPRGLHFTSSRSTVTVKGGKGKSLKFTARLVRGALVLTLRTATPQARVMISSPRLAASGSLTSAIARHQAGRVTLTMRVTDAGKLTTHLSQKIKPS